MLIYFVFFVITVVIYLTMRRKKEIDLSDEHCLITGGSKGIGLAIALQCAKQGASITIIARNTTSLEIAKEKISSVVKNSKQKVLIFSTDISKQEASLKEIITEAVTFGGPITSLFNCAGTSVASSFESTHYDEFTYMMNLNYFGSIKVTQAVLPFMKEQKKGRIVFVSSLAGLIGLYGYSAYSGSKFAIVGLAEALRMEIKPYNISVTVSFPPDTDTPGYAEEIKSKPLETSKMTESGGLFSANDVALKILHDAMDKKFMSSVGFEGWMICNVCSGTTPSSSFLQLIVQVTTMGLCRIALFIYLLQCDYFVKKCFKEKEKKSEDGKE